METHIKTRIYKTAFELADILAQEVYHHLGDLCGSKKTVTVALSGGSTPQLLFKKIAAYHMSFDAAPTWKNVHFFWCDERCVPPHHPESNFGMAKRFLLRALDISESNIHRIKGEDDPEKECLRYTEEISTYASLRNNIPVFDWVFLGMGDDGHTASIFPDQLPLLYTDKICAVAVHPQSGQKRITLTGKPIINAERITFIVTGKSKQQCVKEIFTDDPKSKLYPAKYIKPVRGRLEWFMDIEAAGKIGEII